VTHLQRKLNLDLYRHLLPAGFELDEGDEGGDTDEACTDESARDEATAGTAKPEGTATPGVPAVPTVRPRVEAPVGSAEAEAPRGFALAEAVRVVCTALVAGLREANERPEVCACPANLCLFSEQGMLLLDGLPLRVNLSRPMPLPPPALCVVCAGLLSSAPPGGPRDANEGGVRARAGQRHHRPCCLRGARLRGTSNPPRLATLPP